MKVSHESVPEERSTRVSPTRVSIWAFAFEYVLAFGFVGSSMFFVSCTKGHPVNDANPNVTATTCETLRLRRAGNHVSH